MKSAVTNQTVNRRCGHPNFFLKLQFLTNLHNNKFGFGRTHKILMISPYFLMATQRQVVEPCLIAPLVSSEQFFASSILIASPSPVSSMAKVCNRTLRFRPAITASMRSSCNTSIRHTFFVSPTRTISGNNKLPCVC